MKFELILLFFFQRINTSVRFEENVLVPGLKVERLNNHPFSLYVNSTPTERWPLIPTKLYFKNLKVVGNVTTFPQGFNFIQSMDIRNLANAAVRYNGT